jgi:iron complex outermembrane receptor protein
MINISLVIMLFLVLANNLFAKPFNPAVSMSNLIGVIVDAESGEKIGWTSLYISEINRSVTSHEDGSYHFFDIPSGKYVIQTFRIGYKDEKIPVRIIEDDTTYLRIVLKSNPQSTEGILVESDKFDVISAMQKPDVEVSGKKLRQNLGMTIAKTIDSEPGIAQRTMGPAPARPVLRGLSGDRLLILEDGERTGDLSATSADHAVVIEPMNADRIEVIRGPAALLYGANTIGGVINISRGYVPSTLPHRITGTTSLQGESVNQGYAGGTSLVIPMGSFVSRIDGSYRRANDIHSPQQTLINTNIVTQNASAGLSYFPDWGFLGISGSLYDSDYGIPPDPSGGHPNGVDIELDRKHFEAQAEIFPGLSWMYRTDLSYSYKRYKHTEFESNDQVGVRFGVVTHDINLLTHFNEKGNFLHGEIGLWGEVRDYASSGLNFTPASKEYAYAFFLYGEHDLGRFGFSASLRYDHKSVVPHTEKVVDRADFSLNIHQFDFADLSGGFMAEYNLGKGFSIGSTLMRTFRAPGVEELFSEGPHLAAYAYEVGNSDLGKETGLGTEIFFDYADYRGDIHLAFFRNDINGYIFPQNTGKKSLRRADLFLYQYVGEHALMFGFETTLDYQLFDHWSVLSTMSYVKGDLVDRETSIPRIPPFNGCTGIRFESGSVSLDGAVRFASRQNRLGEFETQTEGYTIFDFSAQYYFQAMDFLHTLTFSVENIGNTVYRQHLNRVKDIMSEPGINFKLLYKTYF